jgi:TonB family protein
VASKNGTAEIVSMEDARARRRAADLDPAGFPDVGVYLRGVREAAGYTLEELAARTHIKAVCLKAIEELDLDALPTRAFAVGFVKTYAEALGLNSGDVVARFKSDAGLGAPLEIETEKFEAAEAAASDAERKELSLWAVVAVVLFIVWCAWQITRPHSEATPFGLEAGPAALIPAPVPPSPEALRGVEPAALPQVVEPLLIERIEPVYPRRCESDAGPVEMVEIAFNITRGGVVSGERVASASKACFNDAALNAVRRWRFSPRTVDGEASPAYDQRYTIRFDRPQ